MSEKLPVLFAIEQPPKDVAIVKDKKTTDKEKSVQVRQRLQARLADAKVYEKLGGKVLKIKARTARSLGDEITALGLRSMGHGRIFIMGDKAETVVDECDSILAQLRAQDPPVDPEKLIGILQIKLAAVKVGLESGEAHLRASTQADAAQNGKAISIPFPANHNLGIAFTPAKPAPSTPD